MSQAQREWEPEEAPQGALSREEVQQRHRQVRDWTLRENSLEREFRFDDFDEAMDFVNDVAALARDADHHPDIHISYNKVRLELTTHRVHGLSGLDFDLAAQVDRLLL